MSTFLGYKEPRRFAALLPDFDRLGEILVGAYLVESSSLRVGDYILIGSGRRPCKITDKRRSYGGKNGMPKFGIDGIDIFTEDKWSTICLIKDSVNVPVVIKKEYKLVDIHQTQYFVNNCLVRYESFKLLDEETGKIIDNEHKLRDKQLDVDIKKNFQEGKVLLVTVISAMGESAIIDFKEY